MNESRLARYRFEFALLCQCHNQPQSPWLAFEATCLEGDITLAIALTEVEVFPCLGHTCYAVMLRSGSCGKTVGLNRPLSVKKLGQSVTLDIRTRVLVEPGLEEIAPGPSESDLGRMQQGLRRIARRAP